MLGTLCTGGLLRGTFQLEELLRGIAPVEVGFGRGEIRLFKFRQNWIVEGGGGRVDLLSAL